MCVSGGGASLDLGLYSLSSKMSYRKISDVSKPRDSVLYWSYRSDSSTAAEMPAELESDWKSANRLETSRDLVVRRLVNRSPGCGLQCDVTKTLPELMLSFAFLGATLNHIPSKLLNV